MSVIEAAVRKSEATHMTLRLNGIKSVMVATAVLTPEQREKWRTSLTMARQIRSVRWKIPVVVAAACLLIFAGCASTPKPDATLQQLANRGYVPKQQHATLMLHETWQRGETPLDVSFIAPSSGGPFPLIVYLPGLGESASAGILWRKAWAEAGYAVFTVQPTDFGETVWTSRQAREGDFQGIAKERFSAPSLQARLEFLDYSLGEMKRRVKLGIVPYSIADTTRVVVAGFDLGAQTALIVAGEKEDGVNVQTANWNVRAVIILSPYVNSAANGIQQNFAAIIIPALCVTGTEDADPYGLVSAPSLRQVPWQSMPPGEKYLLLLKSGTHAVLAGASIYSNREAKSSGEQSETKSKGKKGRHGTGGSVENLSGSEMQFGGSSDEQKGTSDSSGNPDSNAHRKPSRGNRGPQTFDLKSIAAVQDVSTAFLDATVKSDPNAREWLTQDAALWLGQSAVLQVK